MAVTEELGLKIVTEGLNRFMGDMRRADGAVDRSASLWNRAGRAISGIASTAFTAVATGAAATAGAVVGLGVAITKMTLDAAAVEGVRNTFDSLVQSVGGDAVQAMEDLRRATRGMVSDADLMQAGNKFLAMGIATTADEAADLAEIATQLGMAMGEDATSSMENFALMMANQSIPRLDSFGISSGKVRERITELMEANKDLTREQAFNQAVMEQARVTMEKVGEQAGTAGASMASIRAQFENITLQIGQEFLPVLSALLEPVARLVREHGPQLVGVFGQLADMIIPVVDEISNFLGRLLDGQDPLTAFKVLLMNLVPPELFAQIMTIVDGVAAFVEEIQIAFTKKGPEALETLRAAWDKVWTFIQDKVQIFVTWFQENLPLIQEAGNTLVNFWETRIVPALDNIWNIIEIIVDSSIRTVLDIITLVMQIITGDWEGAWETIKTIATRVWDDTKATFIEFIEGVLNSMGTTLDEFLATWEYNWDTAKEIVSTIWENIRSAIIEKAVEIVTGIQEKVQEIKSAFTNIDWRAVGQSVIDKIAGGIRDAIGNLVNAAREAWNAARGAIGGGGGGASGGGGGGDGGYYQHGGTTPGGAFVAGEMGPELITGVPAGAQVMTAPTTSRIMNQITTNNYNLTTNTVTRPGGLRLEFAAMEMGSR